MFWYMHNKSYSGETKNMGNCNGFNIKYNEGDTEFFNPKNKEWNFDEKILSANNIYALQAVKQLKRDAIQNILDLLGSKSFLLRRAHEQKPYPLIIA